MRRFEPFVVTRDDRLRQILRLGLLLIFVGLCAWPYVGWARHPSLFDDDFTRVGGLRTSTPATSLLRPFNEHLAPLFELVGWFAWWGVGRRVERIAAGFLVASYLMAFGTLVSLAAVVRLELRSHLAGLVAASWFALSTVSAETVLWYSASSFQGAAAMSLAAWFAASKAIRSASSRRRRGWLIASALFALLSPLFSAIGVLAGPLATLRLVLASAPERHYVGSRRSWSQAATVPILGTLAYLVLVVANQDHDAAVSASVRTHLDVRAALWAAVRAPSLVLIPEMVGSGSLSGSMPDVYAAGSTLALGLGVLVWSWRSPSKRGLIVVGLGWVVGGYLLAYSTRSQPGDRWILEVGRYHLFPEIGVICWVSGLLGPALDRFEARRPLAGWVGLVVIALVGFAVEATAMSDLTRRSFRYPDQKRSIAATLRLEAICHAEQIPIEQAMRIIDPVEPRWFPRPLPFHPSLYLFGPGPKFEHSRDAEAKAKVIASLSPEDLEGIFGGLDSSRFRVEDQSLAEEAEWIRAEPMEQGVESMIGEGRLFFVEFGMRIEGSDVESLRLTGIKAGTRVEIWWSTGDGRWSASRSVRCTTHNEGEIIPLSRSPHWRRGFARRYRVIRRWWPLLATDHPDLSFTAQHGSPKESIGRVKLPVPRRGDSESRPIP